MLTDAELSQLAYRSSPLFHRFEADDIKHHLDKLAASSEEAEAAAATRAAAAGGDGALGGDPVGEQEPDDEARQRNLEITNGELMIDVAPDAREHALAALPQR